MELEAVLCLSFSIAISKCSLARPSVKLSLSKPYFKQRPSVTECHSR